MRSVKHPAVVEANTWPVLPADVPIIYEDEEEPDLGEANRHHSTNEIVYLGVANFLLERHPQMRVFCNMNCYYAPKPKHKKTGSFPYFSSDNMIVDPFEPLADDTVSYTIGRSGPAPLAAIEALSEGTAKETDFGTKFKLYAYVKIAEYIIVDVTGELLPQKLLLKRLQPDGTWRDEQDADGGVTSSLGFRLIIDEEGDLAVEDAKTGKRYIRPLDAQAMVEAQEKARKLADKKTREAEKKAREAEKKASEAEKKASEAETKVQKEAEARRRAEERLAALQAELDRLRSKQTDS